MLEALSRFPEAITDYQAVSAASNGACCFCSSAKLEPQPDGCQIGQRGCSHAFGSVQERQQLPSLQKALCCSGHQQHLLSSQRAAHPGVHQSLCVSPHLWPFRCWRSSLRIQQPGTTWGMPQQVWPAELSPQLGAPHACPSVHPTALGSLRGIPNLVSCVCRAR